MHHRDRIFERPVREACRTLCAIPFGRSWRNADFSPLDAAASLPLAENAQTALDPTALSFFRFSKASQDAAQLWAAKSTSAETQLDIVPAQR